ncbi:2Fe-2S iron-sulfur cluster-binding protein [Caenimonas terrae]|uniref:2Fe-2S iron-sulfur cluster-binding protein n=1 Tax=Caenimonas terrae TaxID=696074 RepID=A0ABW0NGG4_9BURK
MIFPNDTPAAGLTRREVLCAATAVAAGPAALKGAGAQGTPSTPAAAADPAPQLLTTQLNVNGRLYDLTADARTTLLDALRERLGLGGTKKGCDHGQCGACTVLVDGRRINSCLTLAAMHDGQAITTIEGFASAEQLHPLQQAFLKHDGFQCGYCTPGQICSAAGMLAEAKAGMPSNVTADLRQQPLLSAEEIRERMSGNICRCSAYPNIVAAIEEVAGGRS